MIPDTGNLLGLVKCLNIDRFAVLLTFVPCSLPGWSLCLFSSCTWDNNYFSQNIFLTGKLLEGGSVVSIVGNLKQRRFWANMHINRKWGLFLLLCLDATRCLTKCLHSHRDDIFEWRTLTRSGLCAILHGQCFCPNFCVYHFLKLLNASRIHCPFPSSIPVIRPFPH